MITKKLFGILILILLVLSAIFLTGCIGPDKNNTEEKIAEITETLILNETKTIIIKDVAHSITVKNIIEHKELIVIETDNITIMVDLNKTVQVDTDYDGENDLEIIVTSIDSNKVTITITLTDSVSDFNYCIDDLGSKVKVPKKLNKIISLAPSITEILFELDLGDYIVGIDSASNYPTKCQDIDIVATYEGIDIEAILVKDPDIILMDKTLDLSEKNYEKMIFFGLNVFRLYPLQLQDVLNNIELIGNISDKASNAQSVVNDLKNRIDNVKTRAEVISDSLHPKILHVCYYDGASSPWVHTSSTFSGDLIQISGGIPAVIDDSGKSIQISIEHMIDLNPDMIFTSQDDTWPTPTRKEIFDNDALKGINAVKNNKVFDVTADLVDRPGPRLVDGLELFSEYIVS